MDKFELGLVSKRSKIALVVNPTFLGFILDPSLRFSKAIDSLISRTNSRMSVVRMLKSRIAVGDKRSCFLMRIYKSFVRPILDYYHIALSSLPESGLSRLQVLQNRALRLCLDETRYVKVKDPHAVARIGDVKSRVDLLSASYFCKALSANRMIAGEVSEYLGKRDILEGYKSKKWLPRRTPFSFLISPIEKY